MRDKDIEFIHIISIVIVVYSNGINLKILMSHWRHITTTFKLPQASYIWRHQNSRAILLLKSQPACINQTLHLMFQGHTMLNGMPQNSSMISTCSIRVVSSGKWRLRNLCWDYGYHWNWGEFYRLLFWKIPSLVGILVRINGGVWPRMRNR